ncbi:D-alanine--D-alanine ligase [Reinekea thalattae]|nr:D-alanine--D-alanine ligase [Reinekea thalattae]
MPSTKTAADSSYVCPGMPPLQLGKTTSFFEFWPTWLMYFPISIQWLALSIRYRSLTLPLIANPQLPLSGMVGVGKSELLSQAQGDLNNVILPWFTVTKTEAPLEQQVDQLKLAVTDSGFAYPFVCKPDIGCRGIGVKLIKNEQQLIENFTSYPENAKLFIQKLADFEPEAGVFFTKHPNEKNGKIISMALKYTPYVIGDGEKTLGELIESDQRAGQLIHLYQSRHQQHWNQVIAKDQPYRLVFSASHSKGAIFKQANYLITDALSERLTQLLANLPDFHYGRLDIKFKDTESLSRGEHIQIVEINTASSEPLHIWDSNTPFKEAVRALLFQYRILFVYGNENRKKGFTPPGFKKLIQHWKLERNLSRFYGETD